VFFSSALGVIPTAALMGRATEELAARSGPGIGGLLNVTFGNAPELIIALFALGEGCTRSSRRRSSARSSATSCSSWGPAMTVGGMRQERQRFDATAARRRR
jgi:Ca2+:H+ antiporter